MTYDNVTNQSQIYDYLIPVPHKDCYACPECKREYSAFQLESDSLSLAGYVVFECMCGWRCSITRS